MVDLVVLELLYDFGSAGAFYLHLVLHTSSLDLHPIENEQLMPRSVLHSVGDHIIEGELMRKYHIFHDYD
jgi:hypothetical protein